MECSPPRRLWSPTPDPLPAAARGEPGSTASAGGNGAGLTTSTTIRGGTARQALVPTARVLAPIVLLVGQAQRCGHGPYRGAIVPSGTPSAPYSGRESRQHGGESNLLSSKKSISFLRLYRIPTKQKRLLHIGHQMDHHLAATLHHPKDMRSLFLQCASATFAFESASTAFTLLFPDSPGFSGKILSS